MYLSKWSKHLRDSRLTGWCGKHDLRQKRSKSKFLFSPYWGFVREALHPIFGPQVISSVWGDKCPLEMICKYPLRCYKPTIKTTITITQGLSWMEIISKYPFRSATVLCNNIVSVLPALFRTKRCDTLLQKWSANILSSGRVIVRDITDSWTLWDANRT